MTKPRRKIISAEQEQVVDAIVSGVFKCVKFDEDGDPWLDRAKAEYIVCNQLATVTAERDAARQRVAELEGEFDKLLRSMFRIRALAMKRETCDARAVMDEFHRVAGFYNEPKEQP